MKYFFWIFFGIPIAIFAQQVPKMEIEIGSDNDYKVTTAQTDRYYTYGVDIALRWKPTSPHYLSKYFPNKQNSMSEIQFHMEAYTPEYLQDGSVDPNEERPYAGWSYFRYVHSMAFQKSYLKIGMDLGILGPASMAGKVQNWFHRQISNDVELQGWDEQIPNQIGINLRAAYALSFWKTKYLESFGNVETVLGNIYIYSKPQIQFRFGKMQALPYSIGSNNQLMGNGKDWEAFLETGFGAKISAYNATLQGKIMDGRQLFTYQELNNVIYNFYMRIALRYRYTGIRITYHVATGELHSTETHRFAAFSLAQQF
ncbi:MAG: lipid A deacylase LpxR family protein [Flavobacteriaceae bacterium]|nr:lipid A deacylase LpxR family protein [Flavobacteriaceae bacterium]